MTNVTQDDARKFIEWQLNEKTQFLKARFRKKGSICLNQNTVAEIMGNITEIHL